MAAGSQFDLRCLQGARRQRALGDGDAGSDDDAGLAGAERLERAQPVAERLRVGEDAFVGEGVAFGEGEDGERLAQPGGQLLDQRQRLGRLRHDDQRRRVCRAGEAGDHGRLPRVAHAQDERFALVRARRAQGAEAAGGLDRGQEV